MEHASALATGKVLAEAGKPKTSTARSWSKRRALRPRLRDPKGTGPVDPRSPDLPYADASTLPDRRPAPFSVAFESAPSPFPHDKAGVLVLVPSESFVPRDGVGC
jgi:hypothetical protein